MRLPLLLLLAFTLNAHADIPFVGPLPLSSGKPDAATHEAYRKAMSEREALAQIQRILPAPGIYGWSKDVGRLRRELRENRQVPTTCKKDPICMNELLRQRLIETKDSYAILMAARTCILVRTRGVKSTRTRQDITSVCRKQFQKQPARAREWLASDGTLDRISTGILDYRRAQERAPAHIVRGTPLPLPIPIPTPTGQLTASPDLELGGEMSGSAQ